MELDSRKNEVREAFKRQDIRVEVCNDYNQASLAFHFFYQELLNKSIVNISELRTTIEEIKWHNMRRAVGEYVLRFTLLPLTCQSSSSIAFRVLGCHYSDYGTTSTS
jgi:hypothetical protein